VQKIYFGQTGNLFAFCFGEEGGGGSENLELESLEEKNIFYCFSLQSFSKFFIKTFLILSPNFCDKKV
jgi:hypothetical protein